MGIVLLLLMVMLLSTLKKSLILHRLHTYFSETLALPN